MSDSAMLAAAEAEVQRLEAELAQTDAYKKLQLAKQVVELYRPTASPSCTEHAPVNALASLTTGKVGTLMTRKPPAIFLDKIRATKTAKVEAAAVSYLTRKAARATSGELLEAMKAADIEITGAEPIKALSAYLSNSNALNNVREYGGYGLAEWGADRGPSTSAVE